MKDHTRRVVAYIVGRLLIGQTSPVLYDYQTSRHYSFNGDISPTYISVYDKDHECHIDGAGHNGFFTLFHSGNNRQLDLEIINGEFQGYDHDSGKHYSGSVTGKGISIYDYEFSRYYHFSL